MKKASTSTSMTNLWKWCEDRGDCFGQYSFQVRPVAFSVYQDDILAVEISPNPAEQIDESLPRLLEGKHGIKLSTKDEETKPLGSTVSTIDGTYDLEHSRRIRCSHSPAIKDRYVEMVQDIGRSLGRLRSKQEMQEIADLPNFVALFFVDGTNSSNAVF